jgi:hypothetical protein
MGIITIGIIMATGRDFRIGDCPHFFRANIHVVGNGEATRASGSASI